MTLISKVLGCLLNGKSNFCCLCFDVICEEEIINLEDEVIVNINGSVDNVVISEVLQSVLRDEFDYITTFETLCDKCTNTAINSYTFMQTSKKNSEHMINALQCLTNSIEYTTDNIHGSKSLYLSLNLDEFTSKQFYDCKRLVKNPQAVLRRIRTIDNSRQLKPNSQQSINSQKHTSVNKRKLLTLNTSKILYDKNESHLIKCKDCMKVYPTLISLRSHYARVHAPKNFQCSKCRKKFGSETLLNVHCNTYHCTVVCTECGKTFDNKHSLALHEIRHYMMIVCQDCGRTYKSQASYKKHKDLNVCGQRCRADPANARYTCDYCNKKYTQKVSLRVHIQYEHGNYKAHVCEWCGKKFWAQSRLKAHIVKHTRERNFKCDVCGGKFVTKESLLYHTRIHTGEKPYECPECDSRFLSASRRSDHVKRHHAGASLECDVCFSKFSTKSLLQKHKKIHDDNNKKKDYSGEVNVKYASDETKATVTNNSNLCVDIHNVCENINLRNNAGVEYNSIDIPHYPNETFNENAHSENSAEVYLQVCDEGDDYIIKLTQGEM